MPIDKMPKDKMPNDLLAFCPDFFVFIWHFVRLNLFWRLIRTMSTWFGILSEWQQKKTIKSPDKMPTNHLAFCQLAFCPHTLIQPYQSSINTMSGKSIGRWVTIEIMIGLFSDRLAKLWFWGPCYFHWLCKLWTRGSCLHVVKKYADILMHPLDMENYWLTQMTIHVFFTK